MTSMLDLMNTVVDALKHAVHEDMMATAVSLVETENPDLLLEISYWADPPAFEERIAQRILDGKAVRWVFGTIILIEETDEEIRMRPANPEFPTRANEEEIIWLVAVDLEEGVDIGRVDITRVGGEIIFGDVLVIHGDTQMFAQTPGFTILKTVTSAM